MSTAEAHEVEAVIHAAAHWGACDAESLTQGGIQPADVRLVRAAVAWELARRGMSTTQVGRRLKLHHTSVIHCIKRIGRLIDDHDLWITGLLTRLDEVPLGANGHCLEVDGRLVPIRRVGKSGRRWRIVTRGLVESSHGQTPTKHG